MIVQACEQRAWYGNSDLQNITASEPETPSPGEDWLKGLTGTMAPGRAGIKGLKWLEVITKWPQTHRKQVCVSRFYSLNII